MPPPGDRRRCPLRVKQDRAAFSRCAFDGGKNLEAVLHVSSRFPGKMKIPHSGLEIQAGGPTALMDQLLECLFDSEWFENRVGDEIGFGRGVDLNRFFKVF